MHRHPKQQSLYILLLLIVLFLTLASANAALLPDDAAKPAEITVPADLAPQDVGSFIAPLNDSQVRTLLINNLQQQAELEMEKNAVQSLSVIALLRGAKDPDSPLGKGINATIQASHTFWQEVNKIFEKLSPGEGFAGFMKLLLNLAFVVVLARGVEWLCVYRWKKSAAAESVQLAESGTQKPKSYPYLNFFINQTGLLVFAIAGYTIFELLNEKRISREHLIIVLFGAILTYRLFTLLFKLLLAPSPKGLALIDERISYKSLYVSMASFTFTFLIGTEVIGLFAKNGLPVEHMLLAFMLLFGVFINPIIIWFAWANRYAVDRILFGADDEVVGDSAAYPYASRALVWPSIVTFIILLAFINWQIQTLIGDAERQSAIEIAWWITLLFPIIDLLVSSLLIRLVALDVFQSKGFQKRKLRFMFIIRYVVRLILLSILVISFLEGWGFQPLEKLRSNTGISILSTAVDIGVTILLGFIIWESIQLWMERYLPDEDDQSETEVEGEGGGTAASRGETLLPLFRTILLIVLSLIVVMSVLYSLGVQIGPLLAGAGVVGIAIGFGSQKLVQDIISGMFFLIDDAFRKGEYIEAAGMRGTVEKLSVRSLRLRHHLGAVQTVPYGEINTVKNLSRDWVIMKLELRLPYDVDIEKVRKIIKKVGQKMLLDEEIGPHMLQPLKSQGVMRVEESALIIRMKFTTIPGEQWIVRRVAYTRVRDALAEAGIQFAHREVKVRLPDELEELQKLNPPQQNNANPVSNSGHTEKAATGTLVGAVSAAAMSAVVAEELEKNLKIDDHSDDDER